MTQEQVTTRIREKMAGKRITRTALAPFVGCSGSQLGRKLNDEAPLTVGELLAIANALECSPCDLFEDRRAS